MRKSALPHPVLLTIACVLLPSLAHAHGGEADSFLHGLTHPAGGLDHICAMLAVGLWATQNGGRFLWIMPLAFVGAMALGSALPPSGISLPFVEQGILLSVLLLGTMIAAAVSLPLWLACGIVGLFALWHGQAHSAGLPASAAGFEFGLGFVIATALLHAIGIVSGLAMRRFGRDASCRFAGTAIALCGAYLAAV